MKISKLFPLLITALLSSAATFSITHQQREVSSKSAPTAPSATSLHEVGNVPGAVSLSYRGGVFSTKRIPVGCKSAEIAYKLHGTDNFLTWNCPFATLNLTDASGKPYIVNLNSGDAMMLGLSLLPEDKPSLNLIRQKAATEMLLRQSSSQ